jgi:hypothetical protein
MQFTSIVQVFLLATVVHGIPSPITEPVQPESHNMLERGEGLASRDAKCWITGGASQQCVKSPTNWAKVGTLAAGSSSGPTFGASCYAWGNLWADNGEYSRLYFYVPAYKCYVNSLHVNSACSSGE